MPFLYSWVFFEWWIHDPCGPEPEFNVTAVVEKKEKTTGNKTHSKSTWQTIHTPCSIIFLHVLQSTWSIPYTNHTHREREEDQFLQPTDNTKRKEQQYTYCCSSHSPCPPIPTPIPSMPKKPSGKGNNKPDVHVKRLASVSKYQQKVNQLSNTHLWHPHLSPSHPSDHYCYDHHQHQTQIPPPPFSTSTNALPKTMLYPTYAYHMTACLVIL